MHFTLHPSLHPQPQPHPLPRLQTKVLYACALPSYHPYQVVALHACARCGVHRVLTSGGQPTAAQGAATVRYLVITRIGWAAHCLKGCARQTDRQTDKTDRQKADTHA